MCRKCSRISEIHEEIFQDSADEPFLYPLPIGSNIFIKYVFGINCVKFWWQVINCLESLKELSDEGETGSEKIQNYRERILDIKNEDTTDCNCTKNLEFLKDLLSKIPYVTEYHDELESFEVVNPGSSEFLRKVLGINCVKCELVNDTLKRLLNDKRKLVDDPREKNFLERFSQYFQELLYLK